MARYYYSTTPENPPVYHTNQACEEGEKIKAWDRVDTDKVPAERRPCEVCG